MYSKRSYVNFILICYFYRLWFDLLSVFVLELFECLLGKGEGQWGMVVILLISDVLRGIVEEYTIILYSVTRSLGITYIY